MKIPGGWSRYPHAIHDAISSMNPADVVCMLVLIRETYGYHRRQTKLTYEDFRCQTGIKGRATIAASLKAIEAQGFFRRTGAHRSEWEIGKRLEPDARVKDPEAELERSTAEIVRLDAEPISSKIEPNVRVNSSKIELIAGANSSIIEPNAATNSSNSELKRSQNSSDIEPFLLYKERSPTGKERERERKRSPAQPEVPSPRSAAEMELAAHPAAGTWLEAGMAWPGWQRLEIITQRLGEKPQIEALKKARELWLMAGYRQGNIGGILDWYEAICRDSTWRPFGKTTGHGRPPPNGDAPKSPTMAMLLRMKEERLHGG